jgi:hypothetical protein
MNEKRSVDPWILERVSKLNNGDQVYIDHICDELKTLQDKVSNTAFDKQVSELVDKTIKAMQYMTFTIQSIRDGLSFIAFEVNDDL